MKAFLLLKFPNAIKISNWDWKPLSQSTWRRVLVFKKCFVYETRRKLRSPMILSQSCLKGVTVVLCKKLLRQTSVFAAFNAVGNRKYSLGLRQNSQRGLSMRQQGPRKMFCSLEYLKKTFSLWTAFEVGCNCVCDLFLIVLYTNKIYENCHLWREDLENSRKSKGFSALLFLRMKKRVCNRIDVHWVRKKI